MACKEESGRHSWKRHLVGSGSLSVKKRVQRREEDGVLHDSHRHRHRLLIPAAAATIPSIPPPSSLRCAPSAGFMRERRDEEGEGGARTGLLRRRRPPSSPSPSSSSSPPVTEGKNKKSEIAEAIRDRLRFSSSGTRLSSCWGCIGTRHPVGRSRSRSGTAGDEHGTLLAVMAAIRSSCVCINGNPCGCSSISIGKADVAGVRSLVESNDFYCQDCNTHDC